MNDYATGIEGAEQIAKSFHDISGGISDCASNIRKGIKTIQSNDFKLEIKDCSQETKPSWWDSVKK